MKQTGLYCYESVPFVTVRQQIGRAVLPVVRSLPHRSITVPYPRDRRIALQFYPDTELGLWLGFNEPAVIDWWREAVSPGETVYDIGAHIGVYSLLAGVRGATVQSFEPAPRIADRLRQNIRLNDLSEVVSVHERAVSETDGTVTLYGGTDDRTHTIIADSESETSSEVKCTTIDRATSEMSPPDLVKIDVEAAADSVIRGATDTIREGDTTWMIELHGSSERDAIATRFSQSNYDRTWLDDRHVVLEPATR